MMLAADYADRGRISVIVDNELAAGLASNLAVLQQDMIADGFQVRMHTTAPRMNDQLLLWDNTLDEGRSFGNHNLDPDDVENYLRARVR